MTTLAWACKTSKENLGAIASEAGGHFDRKYAEDWVEEHGEGYFLRDPGSAFDCQFFVDTVFFDLYEFEASSSDNALFRTVVRKRPPHHQQSSR